ncbi:MAG: helix-turn-helix transcriptional regulator [Clostridia bacterium]|nr:helix-turn-helix transcriptional regulator [Clostridia bacterium]
MPFDIKKRREELNLTFEEMGKFIGVSKGTVKKWESGYIKNMRRDKIIKLAEVLKVSPMDILRSAEDDHSFPGSRKVPLTKDLRKEYKKFISSVFNLKEAGPSIIIYKDSDLIFINSDDENIEQILKLI